jgi:signal transduction histidine kinase
MATVWRLRKLVSLPLATLGGRLAVAHLLVVLPGLLALVIWAGIRMSHDISAKYREALLRTASLMATVLDEELESGPRVPAGVYAHALGELAGVSLAILDEKGNVVAASDDYPWGEDEEASSFMMAAAVIGDPRMPRGVLVAGRPKGPMNAEIRNTWLALGGMGLLVLGASVAASLLLARHISRPVRELTASAAALARGDLGQSVVPQGPVETRQLAEAFNTMAHRLRSWLERQLALVAEAAHELRSPLASVRLRLEMAQAHGERDPETARRYLALALEEVERLDRLAHQLLSLSSVDAQLARGAQPMDPAPVLFQVADSMMVLAQHKGLQMQVDVPPHLPLVRASAELLSTAVRNLLDNAIKFTPPGGSVRLSAQAVGGQVEIAVSDSGVGIPPDELPYIFQRFRRGRHGTGERGSGAGLGLALVKTIAEGYGGQVKVESRLGEGSTFVLALPCAEASQGTSGA